MYTHCLTVVRLIAVAALTVGLAGCATAGPRAEPVAAGGGASAEKPAESGAGEAVKTAEEAEKKAKEKEKQAEQEAEDARKLAKLERDLAVARQRVVRARMDAEHAEGEHKATLDNAQQELALELMRQSIFTERSAPNRIEWSKLGLLRGQDRVLEAQEELRQLELMYAEEDFADQTKEIVLHRSRRRLERSNRDLDLRREDAAILTDKTIPLETAEHEGRVMQKTAALDKARRATEASRLDKQIALMSAEAEVARLEAEIDALGEKMEKRQKEREEKASEKE